MSYSFLGADSELFKRGFKISEGVRIYSYHKVLANNIDANQTLQNAASD